MDENINTHILLLFFRTYDKLENLINSFIFLYFSIFHPQIFRKFYQKKE